MHTKNKLTFICDQRERASQVMLELKKLKTKDISIDIKLELLAVGDYQLSNDVVVERKTIADLETSVIDGRIFSQLQNLLQVPKPCLIIEGNMDFIYNGDSRLNKKAIIGLLTSIGINYKVPVFFTKNHKETAEFLYVIAKREQLGNGNNLFKLRYNKTKMSFSQRQLFIMESFPDVGPTLSRAIFKHFKTLKNIADADIKDLTKVPKLGPKKADKIKYLFEREFSD